MELVIIILSAIGVATVAILYKTLTYMERAEKAIKERRG